MLNTSAFVICSVGLPFLYVLHIFHLCATRIRGRILFISSKYALVVLPVKHLLTLLHSSCYQAQKTAPKGGFRIFSFQLICASGCFAHPHRNPQNPRHYALFTTLSRLFPSHPIFSFNSLRHSTAEKPRNTNVRPSLPTFHVRIYFTSK